MHLQGIRVSNKDCLDVSICATIVGKVGTVEIAVVELNSRHNMFQHFSPDKKCPLCNLLGTLMELSNLIGLIFVKSATFA